MNIPFLKGNLGIINTKSEDKSVDVAGSVGAHVEEATSAKDKTSTSSDSSSIGALVSDVTKTVVKPTQCVQEVLVTYSTDDPI